MNYPCNLVSDIRDLYSVICLLSSVIKLQFTCYELPIWLRIPNSTIRSISWQM
jgi:hypothetical protein